MRASIHDARAVKEMGRLYDNRMPPEEPEWKCRLCSGDGYQLQQGPHGWDKYDCPRCGGTGREE